MSLWCHCNTGADVPKEFQVSMRSTAIRTDESSSFRPIDAFGSASIQSPEPSAKAANNLACSTGSGVSLSKLSDSELQMRSSQFCCSPIVIGSVVLLKGESRCHAVPSMTIELNQCSVSSDIAGRWEEDSKWGRRYKQLMPGRQKIPVTVVLLSLLRCLPIWPTSLMPWFVWQTDVQYFRHCRSEDIVVCSSSGLFSSWWRCSQKESSYPINLSHNPSGVSTNLI